MDPQHEQAERERVEVARRARIQAKLEAAMRLPDRIEVPFWGKTPLMSPRVAALMGDRETREIFMRAVRGLRRTEGSA